MYRTFKRGVHGVVRNARPVAVVTGGTRGIGKRIASGLADRGFNVLSRSANCHETASLLPQGNHRGFVCDVSSSASVVKTVSEIEKEMGFIEVLVNSAGIAKDALLLHVQEADLQQIMATNVFGTVYMTKAVSKGMIKHKKGNIVNIGSVVGISGDPGQTAYSASKAALTGLTKTWAQELGSRGIRVNMVAPGFIETDMTKHLTEERKQQILSKIVLGRFGTPDDVWFAVEFLLTNTYVTGESLVVNGGFRS